jgi:hypothetical protein
MVLMPRVLRGENHPRARYSETLVRELRRRAKLAGPQNRPAALAKEYGIPRGSIDGLLRGRTWAHVE